MIVAITTCKGRLSHLKKTLPRMVAEFSRVVVVDWYCPEGSGEWAEKNGAEVVYGPCEDNFHKTSALNLGASYAIISGATRLVFIDADTLIIKPILDYLERLYSDEIAVTGPKNKSECRKDNSCLSGFLSCSASAFQQVNGYDESYIGWGYQDMDMRLRLAMAGKKIQYLNEAHFATIAHSNELRTAYQNETWIQSKNRNRKKFDESIKHLKLSQQLKDLVYL